MIVGGWFQKKKKTPQQLTRPTFNLAELLRSNQSQNSLPWKKTNDWSLDVEAKSRHWETLLQITAEWKQVKEDNYAMSEQWNGWNLVHKELCPRFCPTLLGDCSSLPYLLVFLSHVLRLCYSHGCTDWLLCMPILIRWVYFLGWAVTVFYSETNSRFYKYFCQDSKVQSGILQFMKKKCTQW